MLHLYHVCVYCVVVLKKVKHRLVEKMKESTADTLGLSRAVLVNGQSVYHVFCLVCTEYTWCAVLDMSRCIFISCTSQCVCVFIVFYHCR